MTLYHALKIKLLIIKGLPPRSLRSRLGFFSIYPVHLNREFSIWFHFYTEQRIFFFISYKFQNKTSLERRLPGGGDL